MGCITVAHQKCPIVFHTIDHCGLYLEPVVQLSEHVTESRCASIGHSGWSQAGCDKQTRCRVGLVTTLISLVSWWQP